MKKDPKLETQIQTEAIILEEIILETLAHGRPLTRVEMLLQMDTKKIEQCRHLTMEDLDQGLRSLIQKRQISQVLHKGEEAWKRPLVRGLSPSRDYVQGQGQASLTSHDTASNSIGNKGEFWGRPFRKTIN